MNLNYGDVLTRAWQIVWKHKILWIFGILAGCTQGGSGGGSGGGGGGGGGSQGPASPEMQRAFENFMQWYSENTWILAVVVVVLLLLWLLAIFLGTIGRVGLIRGTLQAEAGQASLSFGPLFSESMAFFWRVLGLGLLFVLAVLIVVAPFVVLSVLTAGVGLACLLPLICILVPIGWVASVVIEQSNVAIVSENLSILDGLQRGWEVVRGNVGAVLVMALILFGLSFVAGLVIAIPILIIVVPIALATAVGNNESTTPLMVAGVCVLAYLPILITARGILTAYIGSVWTLTYTRLTGSKESSPAPITTNA